MASALGASIGLNILQIVQNELQSREILEGHLGYGIRLKDIDERLANAEAIARNGRVWKLSHHLEAVAAPQKDPKRDRAVWKVHSSYPKTVGEFKGLVDEPEKIRALLAYYKVTVYAVRSEEDEVSSSSSSSSSDSDTDSAQYTIPHYATAQRVEKRRARLRTVDLHRSDQLRDIRDNLEGCMEELAISWGLDWQKIGGLTIAPRDDVLARAQQPAVSNPQPAIYSNTQYRPPIPKVWSQQR